MGLISKLKLRGISHPSIEPSVSKLGIQATKEIQIIDIAINKSEEWYWIYRYNTYTIETHAPKSMKHKRKMQLNIILSLKPSKSKLITEFKRKPTLKKHPN